jgi:hypothetical protein
MALRIEKPGRTAEYVLLADRESSQPTKFILRPLTWEEENEAEEHAPPQSMTAAQAAAIGEVMQQVRAEGRDTTDLTAAEIARINEIAPPDARRINLMTKQHAVRCRHGIVEIRGLLDRDDKPMTMTGAEFARRAPQDAIWELGVEIQRLSRLSEDVIKK